MPFTTDPATRATASRAGTIVRPMGATLGRRPARTRGREPISLRARPPKSPRSAGRHDGVGDPDGIGGQVGDTDTTVGPAGEVETPPASYGPPQRGEGGAVADLVLQM